MTTYLSVLPEFRSDPRLAPLLNAEVRAEAIKARADI